LSGSQERGDKYVSFCLETLIAEPGLLGRGPASRLSVYKLFHQICAGVVTQLEHSEAGAKSPLGTLDFFVQEIPPVERQVLLLTTLEGFSKTEAAEILQIDALTAEQMLATARDLLNKQTLSSALIIEDEPIIAFDIASIVSEIGHTIVGTATTHSSAVALAKEKRPGFVLADIKLNGGGSGIDAVGDILQHMDVPVIFVTAYPERLLSGKRREPAYLVTKPFEADELKVAIYQALLSDKTRHHQRAVG